MKKYIRKADIVLLIVLIAAGLLATAALAMSHSAGDTVVIESQGKLYAKYSLFEDRELSVPVQGRSGEYNIVTIRDGHVSVTEASCKNQVCVHHSSIHRGGENIVCLPNRLVVRIEGGNDEGGGYDSITS